MRVGNLSRWILEKRAILLHLDGPQVPAIEIQLYPERSVEQKYRLERCLGSREWHCEFGQGHLADCGNRQRNTSRLLTGRPCQQL